MRKTKYEKYILLPTGSKKSTAPLPAVSPEVLTGVRDWAGIQHRMNWKYISQPIMLVSEPHTHDFEQFLVLLGNNAANAADFGAEAEIFLGEEGEKQFIKDATVICIPRGLVHGPFKITKVNKPFLFCNIYLAPEYIRKPATR